MTSTNAFEPAGISHAARRARATRPSPPSPLATNESLYLLYDLGRNYTCQGLFEVENADGGEEIVISYAEKFRDGELVLSDPLTYCRVRLTDRFRLRPGDQTVSGFTFRGGRYLLVQIVGPTNSAFVIRPRVTIAQYPLAITKPLDLGRSNAERHRRHV